MRIPKDQFSARAQAAEANLEMWRAITAPFFSVTPTQALTEGFDMQADIVALDELVVIRTASSAQSFLRAKPHLGMSAWDTLMVQLYVTGGYVGDVSGADIVVRPGDICILDLSRGLQTTASEFSNITVGVPRRMVSRALSAFYHGRVIPRENTMAPLIALHLEYLSAHASQMTPIEIEAGVAALVSLIEGIGHQTDQSNGRAAYLATAMQQVVTYIDMHLGATDLSPETLAAACNMSRATLYRLTSEEGGVRSLVQKRRLDRAWTMIVDSRSRLSLEDIGYACGFATGAHFSRCFKEAFGLPPAQLRQKVLRGEPVAHLRRGQQAQDWLADLRRIQTKLQAGGL